MKLQETEQLVLAVCPVTKDTGRLVPRAKRDGKLAQFEADTRALREIVYGKGSGQGRQGKWEAEAYEWMADHQNHLDCFVEMRAVRAYLPVLCGAVCSGCVGSSVCAHSPACRCLSALLASSSTSRRHSRTAAHLRTTSAR